MYRRMTAFTLSFLFLVLGQPRGYDAGLAQAGSTYEIRITNLTPGQSFTPILGATHSADASVFVPGTAASPELKALVEGGDIAPLTALLNSTPGSVVEVASTPGLTTPAVTRSLTLMGGGTYDLLSLAAMLIPTNDAFVGLDTSLPVAGETKVVYAYAYDAGTEVNDERCASIPGPDFPECGGPGTGGSPGNGEGAIVISSGSHGIGDFARNRDWKNPVARITIYRIP